MFFGTVGYAQLKVVAPNGDVKIGETLNAPTAKLSVENISGGAIEAKAYGTGLIFESNDPTGSFSARLTKKNFAGGVNYGVLQINRETNNNFAGNGISFASGNSASISAQKEYAYIGFIPDNLTANSEGGDITLRTTNGGVVRNEVMRLKANGNVGIGVFNPSFKLQVNGSAAKPGSGLWTVASDKSLKKDIKNFELGLNEVLKINPVYFKYNGKGGITDTKTEYVGIIAQEIKKVIPNSVTEFEYTEISEITGDGSNGSRRVNEGGTEKYLNFNPNTLLYMYANAFKDQQNQIDEKEAKIEELEAKFEKLNTLVESMIKEGTSINQTNVNISQIDRATLEQNTPNPFDRGTTINYYIPENAISSQINIYSFDGKSLKSVKLDHIGRGTLNLDIYELSSGTYLYELVIDGKKIDSKKMVLAN